MKIRSDFVTNSSSSSFVTIRILTKSFSLSDKDFDVSEGTEIYQLPIVSSMEEVLAFINKYLYSGNDISKNIEYLSFDDIDYIELTSGTDSYGEFGDEKDETTVWYGPKSKDWYENKDEMLAAEGITDEKNRVRLSNPSFNNKNNGFVISGTTLKKYTGTAKEVVVPDGIKKIGDKAFEFLPTVESVVLPDSVEEIGSRVFGWCFQLESIVIPSGLKAIGSMAFGGFENWSTNECFRLTKLIPGKGITSISGGPLGLVYERLFTKDLLHYKDETRARILSFWLTDYFDLIKNDDMLKKVKANRKEIFRYSIEKDNDEIVKKMFDIGIKYKADEVKELLKQAEEKNAVKVQEYLKSYLDTVAAKSKNREKQETNEKTADEWKRIFKIDPVDDGVVISGIPYGSDIAKNDVIEIPKYIGKNKVVALTASLFSDFSWKKEVIIPDSSIVFPKKIISNENIKILDSADSNGTKDVWKAKALKDGTLKIVCYCGDDEENVVVPGEINGKKVTVLGKNLFYGHDEIRTVVISENIIEIESDCFYAVHNVEKVHLPNSLLKIGARGLSWVNSVDVPQSVIKIGGGAFQDSKTVIIRGNPELVKNLQIFMRGAKVYSDNFEIAKYCRTTGCSCYPLSEAPNIDF